MSQSSTTREKALAFIEDVRGAQALRGVPLRGGNYITDEQIDTIASSVEALGLPDVFNTASGATVLKKLLERFEEMCRRNDMTVPPELREDISSIFLEDIIANVVAFNSEKKPSKLIPLTLYHGSTFAQALQEDEFAAFKDTPGIFKYAAVNYPRDPRGFFAGRAGRHQGDGRGRGVCGL